MAHEIHSDDNNTRSMVGALKTNLHALFTERLSSSIPLAPTKTLLVYSLGNPKNADQRNNGNQFLLRFLTEKTRNHFFYSRQYELKLKIEINIGIMKNCTKSMTCRFVCSFLFVCSLNLAIVPY